MIYLRFEERRQNLNKLCNSFKKKRFKKYKKELEQNGKNVQILNGKKIIATDLYSKGFNQDDELPLILSKDDKGNFHIVKWDKGASRGSQAGAILWNVEFKFLRIKIDENGSQPFSDFFGNTREERNKGVQYLEKKDNESRKKSCKNIIDLEKLPFIKGDEVWDTVNERRAFVFKYNKGNTKDYNIVYKTDLNREQIDKIKKRRELPNCQQHIIGFSSGGLKKVGVKEWINEHPPVLTIVGLVISGIILYYTIYSS